MTLYPSTPADDSATQSTLSFAYSEPSNIRTLSTNTVSDGSSIGGLIYTPDLSQTDPCYNLSTPYIPTNVTRQPNLPDTDYSLVAIAPWISPTCTLNYLASARRDPIRAFIFFLPADQGQIPPTANDAVWGLGDGGQWKRNNEYPVYAISADDAGNILRASALYSGNMTSVPFGHLLTEQYDPRDYVRLYLNIDTGSSPSMPSLWIFLLIILAILLAIVGAISFAMHVVQRRRRNLLRQRVANGEVDLEALGIKRLTVPQEILLSMPLYTYGTVPSVSEKPNYKASAETVEAQAQAPLELTRQLDQPTCPICLDDFVSHETNIRQLPCRHIFHPDCVDAYLRDNSSLCPLCKKSALPKGYCPANVSNAMVRRERMIRGLRPGAETVATPVGWRVLSWLGRKLSWRRPREGRDGGVDAAVEAGAGAGSEAGVATGAVEMLPRAEVGTVEEPSQPPPPLETQSRREWARQRAVAMLGPRPAADVEGQQGGSRWRKWVRSAFPSG